MLLTVLFLAGCGGQNRNLKINSKNLVGTWRYDSFTNASNSTVKMDDHPYYLHLDKDGTYVTEEYEVNRIYQYDSGKWSVSNDSLYLFSENLEATKAPMATIDRVKKNKLVLRYGNGHEYYGTATLSRTGKVETFEVSRDQLTGRWIINWTSVMDTNGNETKQLLNGTLILRNDGSALLSKDGVDENGNWSSNKDRTILCCGRTIRLLILTTNTCILKVATSKQTRFYGLTRYLNPNDE
ncbi:MAG: hypothetical protein SPJ13_07895 [Bacteroidales bacterium]|nr:hypothetical protein [Bacteroidales bacterium]